MLHLKKNFEKWVRQRSNQHQSTHDLLYRDRTPPTEILKFALAAYKKGYEDGLK
jgi:hypothetical protein